MKRYVIRRTGQELYVALNRPPRSGQFAHEARKSGWRLTRWVRDLIDAEKFASKSFAERQAGPLLDFGWEVADVRDDLDQLGVA